MVLQIAQLSRDCLRRTKNVNGCNVVKLLALALTNLDLANLVPNLAFAVLVNNLTKPSLHLDKSGPGLTL